MDPSGALQRALTSRAGDALVNEFRRLKTHSSAVLHQAVDFPENALVVDDFYPNPTSGFRTAEFDALVKHLPTVRIISSSPFASEAASMVGKRSVTFVSSLEKVGMARGYYGVFLSNAQRLMCIANHYQAPFSFTLYPGGGFSLGDARSLRLLSKVAKSPWLQRVLVTQPAVLEHLEVHFPQLTTRTLYCYGVPSFSAFSSSPLPRPSDSRDAPLRVAFVAHRYHPRGLDKGADIASRAVSKMVKSGIDVELHVVGPWPRELFEVEYSVAVQLHGLLTAEELQVLLRSCDVAVFPTRAGVLGPGQFDGFPLTAAVEAALNGCAIVMTNPLNQLAPLAPDRDYLPIGPSSNELADVLTYLAESRAHLAELRTAQTSRWQELFGATTQIGPRIEILTELQR